MTEEHRSRCLCAVYGPFACGGLVASDPGEHEGLHAGDGLLLETARLRPLDVGLCRDRVCMIKHGLGDQDVAAGRLVMLGRNAAAEEYGGEVVYEPVDRGAPRSKLRCAH